MYKEIIAILPEQVKGKGIYSRIYTEDKSILDPRTPSLYLKNLYESRGKNKRQMDKRIRQTYQIYRNIPYAIDSNHVFFGFKLRSTNIKDNNRAFVNVKFIKEIKNNNLILDTGEEIQTETASKTLIQNKIVAQALLMEEIIDKTLEREKSVRYMVGYLR